MKLNKEVSLSFISKKEICFFLFYQLKGIPKKLLPFQSGVGNVANAVLACIGKYKICIQIKNWIK